MIRRLVGAAATLGIAVLLVGLPAVLLQLGFGTLPTITSWGDVVGLLLQRDDGTLALVVIKALGWFTWALLAGLIVLELIGRARGVQPRDLPGLRLPQVAARQLVAAAAALFVALPAHTLVAHADPLPTPTVSVIQAIAPVPVPSADQGSAPTAVEAPAAPAQTKQHIVKRGESLWSIAAAELGHGRRYTEIAALNTDLLQGKGDDFLRPGWILTLPVDATDASPVDSYTVRQGDTLSEIARDRLGDARAYPAIVEASRTIAQPGGRHLTDPDVIDVGWRLAIPRADAESATEPPTVSPDKAQEKTAPTTAANEPTPAASVSSSVGPVAATPAVSPAQHTPAAEAQPSQTTPASGTPAGQADAVDDSAAPNPSWLVAGLVGAGSIFAGSLWLVLRGRRAAQLRRRRPGRMIALPPPELAPIDKTLRSEGQAVALDVAFIDEALRRLAGHQAKAAHSMPPVAAVEFGGDRLRLHLAEPADLPSPWHQAPDRLHWEIPTTVDLAEIGPLDRAMPASYQQLVTLGIDERGHHWLYNLEEAGILRVHGDPDRVHDFARHTAAELAVNPWAREVTVECFGIAAEAVALHPYRVRHHDTPDVTAQVIADTVTQIDLTREANLDIATGRATLLDDPIWDSRHLLLKAAPNELTDQLAQLLRDHPRRTGTALLLVDVNGHHADTDADVIHLTSDGRLHLVGVGLDLVAAGLTAQELAGCAAVLAQADQPDVGYPEHPEPADGWRAHTNQAGQLRSDLTLPRDETPDELVTNLLREDDEVYLDVAAVTRDDLDDLAPHVPALVGEQLEKDDPTLDDDLRTWFDPQCDLPKLMLLGPLTVRVAPTGTPSAAATRKPYYSELLAFLATRSHGATTEEVADAMRIHIGRVRKDILTLRTWLGVNPRTGRPHVPDSRHTDAARLRGIPAYEVEDLLVDADLFRRLRARGEACAAGGLDDLRCALTLVKGTPFGQLRAAGGAWLSDGQRLDQILQCSIVDVAHVVATASLAQGNPAVAQATAELAVRVAPDEESPQLDLVAALEALGHHHAAEQLLRQQVCNRSDDPEDDTPEDLPDRSVEIIRTRQWLARPNAKASA